MKPLIAWAASGLSLLLVVVMLICAYVLIGDLEAAGLKRPALLAVGIWLAGSAANYLRKLGQELTLRRSPPAADARTCAETDCSASAHRSL